MPKTEALSTLDSIKEREETLSFHFFPPSVEESSTEIYPPPTISSGMISVVSNRKPNWKQFKQKGFITSCNKKFGIWKFSGLTSRIQAPPSFLLCHCHLQTTGSVLTAVSLGAQYSCHSSRSQMQTQQCQTEKHTFSLIDKEKVEV